MVVEKGQGENHRYTGTVLLYGTSRLNAMQVRQNRGQTVNLDTPNNVIPGMHVPAFGVGAAVQVLVLVPRFYRPQNIIGSATIACLSRFCCSCRPQERDELLEGLEIYDVLLLPAKGPALPFLLGPARVLTPTK